MGISSYDEATSGDTDNRDPINGRTPADERYPFLDTRGTFRGIVGNNNKSLPGGDSDYFVVDIRDGYNDTAGSVSPGTFLSITGTASAGTTIELQYRIVNYAYLDTYGPYGQITIDQTSESSSVIYTGVDVPSSGLPAQAVLAFQIVGYDASGSYNLRLGGALGGGTGRTFVGNGRGEIFRLYENGEGIDVSGAGGTDFIWTGSGPDTLRGGADRDILVGGDNADILYAEDDTEALSGSSNQLLGGRGADTSYGGGGGDYINGEWDNDTSFGKAGNDVIYGGFGDDYSDGGAGNDQLWGGSPVQLDTSVFGDAIAIDGNGVSGDAMQIEYWSIPGEEQSSDTGRDTLVGGAGNDTAIGGDGDDFLLGNIGDDILLGNRQNDIIFGGQGGDVTYAGSGDDRSFGNIGNDLMFGNIGSDQLYGGQDSDTIFGGQGDDIISGDLGDDLMSGDLGADTFMSSSRQGNDVIRGFDYQQGDRIVTADDFELDYQEDGSVILTYSEGGRLTIIGLQPIPYTFNPITGELR